MSCHTEGSDFVRPLSSLLKWFFGVFYRFSANIHVSCEFDQLRFPVLEMSRLWFEAPWQSTLTRVYCQNRQNTAVPSRNSSGRGRVHTARKQRLNSSAEKQLRNPFGTAPTFLTKNYLETERENSCRCSYKGEVGGKQTEKALHANTQRPASKWLACTIRYNRTADTDY